MKNKKVLLLNIITISTIVAFVVGATYAYFTAQGGDPTSANLNVTTYTTDVFTFTTGSDINIYADQSTFASGKGNATGSTFARATLTANNKTNIATDHYNVYFNIENNTFEYSIDESTPELILTVTDSAGAEVTDISGLTHTSVTDGSGASISGYDITSKSGIITLFNNREITASPSKEETWNIKLTFVNYNKDQNKNTGKAFNAKIKIQKNSESTTLADYVKSLYTETQGENGIYFHDSSLTNGAGDNSYRYAEASGAVNNYICLGSTESPCPDDNLFRIIGVFGDQVKVISASSIGNMAWDSNGSNTWSTSSLNTYLNETYLTSLGTLSDKIATTTWKVGGNTWTNVGNAVPATAYQNEIVAPEPDSGSTTGETEYSAKIGLMYASDYGFAAATSAWTKTLSSYDGKDGNGVAIKTINWLYLGSYEWTISRNADFVGGALGVYSTGGVGISDVDSGNGVRPTFNLLSSVTYAGGTGTSSEPITIN